MRVLDWRNARMKAWSASSCVMAASGVCPDSLAARYAGVSRTKACTRSLLAAQPERGAHAASAMPCNWLPWRATAWLASACRRESMVVRTTSPSV